MKRFTLRRDELWKRIIRSSFQSAIHFFFPKFCDEVDWPRGYEFLDKELPSIRPKSRQRGRIADVLAKVWLKTGEELWIVIHIEVQGQTDQHFDRRMYVYQYRADDRFNVDIVGLAILVDENPGFRPFFYKKERWGTSVRYDFLAYKLLDADPAELAASDNIFATVMLIARHGMKRNLLSDEKLMELKMYALRKLRQDGFSRDEITGVLVFIENYVHFAKPENEANFVLESNHLLTGKIENMNTLAEYATEQLKKHNYREGKKEGKLEGKLEVFKTATVKMLEKGSSIAEIAEILDCPIEIVEQIAKKWADGEFPKNRPSDN